MKIRHIGGTTSISDTRYFSIHLHVSTGSNFCITTVGMPREKGKCKSFIAPDNDRSILQHNVVPSSLTVYVIERECTQHDGFLRRTSLGINGVHHSHQRGQIPMRGLGPM